MQDIRYSRTEQWICDAGWKLLREKHVDKVTVQEICRCAQISRNTFYSHFLDKYELVDKLVLRFVHQITGEIPKVNQDSSFEEAITTTARTLFSYLLKNRDELNICVANHPGFWGVLFSELRDLIYEYIEATPQNRLYATYACGGLIRCLSEFFSGTLLISESDFLRYLPKIASKSNQIMWPKQ